MTRVDVLAAVLPRDYPTARRHTDTHIRRCGNCGGWNLIGRLCPTCHIYWQRWASGQETQFDPYSTSGEAPR